MNQSFYTVRYQFDFQKASITDTYHGVYLGLGYGFGAEARADIQLYIGIVAERIYGLESQTQQKLHLFLNPLLQVNYYLFSRKK
jgi:hypothetical protein